MSDTNMAVAITLYHPDEKIAENILRISSYFETIYLFDNTESKTKTDKMRNLLHKKGIKYATKNKNTGLAYALNVCCHAAYKAGYQWIMLLDQDSVITKDTLDEMKDFIEHWDSKRLGIVAPRIEDYGLRCVKSKGAKEKTQVITSGMILKLEAFKNIGGFLNDLFLYYVDFEYCYRLRKKGYIILQNQGAILYHNQYDKEKSINGYKIDKNTPLRHYYHAKGYYYIIEHYADEESIGDRKKSERQRWRLILLYETDRARKILAYLLAFLDYKVGYFGVCRWKILM